MAGVDTSADRLFMPVLGFGTVLVLVDSGLGAAAFSAKTGLDLTLIYAHH
jgi:hypothetical protein